MTDQAAKCWQHALAHINQHDYAQALPLLQQAAQLAHCQAQYKLATLLLTGRGINKDIAQAQHWFTAAAVGLREAACWDDAEAQCRLGWMYSHGMGVPQDREAALRWLQQAAQQHNTDARYQLALLYQQERQFDHAFALLQQAAYAGHRHAQYRFGLAYLHGQGTAVDEVNAAHWLQQAVEQGVTAAQAALAQCRVEVTTVTQQYTVDQETGLELNPEFQQAFNLIEHTHDCLFLTGKAGTGKSTLLNYFRQRTQKKVVVLAPTGVAALNVNGETIHSFFRLPARPLLPEEVKPVGKKRQRIYRKIDTIIIDEVSMVRVDLLDVIDQFLRLNGRNANAPFGGVQLIFIGDLFQLPPVIASQEEQRLFETIYDSPFFLSAQVFQELPIQLIELRRIYRQQERHFIDLLNAIRNNQLTSAQLHALNQRYLPDFPVTDDEALFITLTTTNRRADEINNARLAQLNTNEKYYECEASGLFEKNNAPAEWKLCLKVGAQVMFVRNDTENNRWVNGTLGRVTRLKTEMVEVESASGKRYEVTPVKWEILKYQFDEEKNKINTDVVGSFIQYPLRLAWAITIHKSQGKTFDRVVIDLGRGAFAHGQLYVALSRCRTLEGLVLKSLIKMHDVIVDKRLQQLLGRWQS